MATKDERPEPVQPAQMTVLAFKASAFDKVTCPSSQLVTFGLPVPLPPPPGGLPAAMTRPPVVRQ